MNCTAVSHFLWIIQQQSDSHLLVSALSDFVVGRSQISFENIALQPARLEVHAGRRRGLSGCFAAACY